MRSTLVALLLSSVARADPPTADAGPEAPSWGLALGTIGVGGTGPAPEVETRWDELQVAGALSVAHVEKTLARESTVFRTCALSAAMRGVVAGPVKVGLDVGADGVVGEVTLEGDDEQIVACLKDHLARGRFHSPGATSRVTATFVWSASPPG